MSDVFSFSPHSSSGRTAMKLLVRSEESALVLNNGDIAGFDDEDRIVSKSGYIS